MPVWRNKWEVQPLDVPILVWWCNRKGHRVSNQSLHRHLIGLVAHSVRAAHS